jgi:8-oxo-dGTP diphosphatase
VSNEPAAVELPRVRVVAAALYDRAGRVLISERPPGKHLAGRWEFPGGKLDPGETEEGALARELMEELGITLVSARRLMRVDHRYDDRHVDIALWVVEEFRGTPAGLDGQQLKWVALPRLHEEDMLAADVPFIAALQRLYNERHP